MLGQENESISKLSDATHLVIDAAGRLFEHLGYRNIVGRTWAVLLLSSYPLDAPGLRNTLGVSAGALSMALKELVNLGLIYRETTKGRRRFYYRAETDLWIVATQVFRKRERKRLESILKQIKQAEKLLATSAEGLENTEEVTYQLEQIRRLASTGEFVIGLLNAVMERTKVELKAAQKWLSVSGRMGGEPLSRIRRAINASRMVRKRKL
ncbi:MAG: hypothetical protein GY847_34560 [Proteobacteria bacterium]|nr:hypothetical protein [Pseudomonadota bacterium]